MPILHSCHYIPPTLTLSAIVLLTLFLTLSCSQFGSARIKLLFPAEAGTKTCAPLQLNTCLRTASATSSGSINTAPRFFNSSSTGARSGVRTQLGWMELVRMDGAL